jgi:Protein of unknown function (DUF3465)
VAGHAQTSLIANNIELALRIASLRIGGTASFFGKFARSEKGVGVGWSRSDPLGRLVAGWLEHDGRRYQ